jgi:hypothetical protein
VTIGSERDIRYSELGRVLQEYQPEILLLPANWEYNFELIQKIIAFSMKYITTLHGVVFSNTRNLAVANTKNKTKKIKSTGWIDVDIG